MLLFPGSKTKVPNWVAILCLVVLAVFFYFWTIKESDKLVAQKIVYCQEYARYYPSVGLWGYFDMFEIGGYYKTQEEAFNQCMRPHPYP